MIDLASIQSNHFERQFDTLELSQDFFDIFKLMFKLDAESKGLALDFSLGSGLAGQQATLDIRRTKQILQNLIQNAIKYTPKGYVMVSVKRSSRGSSLLFSVNDTGPGLPLQVHNKLNWLFWAVDLDHKKRQDTGSGIGLVACYYLARRIGGGLSIKSDIKTGTTIEFEVESLIKQSNAIRRDTSPNTIGGGWVYAFESMSQGSKTWDQAFKKFLSTK